MSRYTKNENEAVHFYCAYENPEVTVDGIRSHIDDMIVRTILNHKAAYAISSDGKHAILGLCFSTVTLPEVTEDKMKTLCIEAAKPNYFYDAVTYSQTFKAGSLITTEFHLDLTKVLKKVADMLTA